MDKIVRTSFFCRFKGNVLYNCRSTLNSSCLHKVKLSNWHKNLNAKTNVNAKLQPLEFSRKNTFVNIHSSKYNCRNYYGASTRNVFFQRNKYQNLYYMKGDLHASCSLQHTLHQINRWLTTSSVCFLSNKPSNNCDQNGHERNQNNDEDDDDKIGFPRGSFLAVMTVLGILAYMTVSTLSSYNETPISWKDFVREMLAKGEVKEVVYYPSFNRVDVELVPGAVLNGTKVAKRTFSVAMPKGMNFEETLRQEEARLNIPPSRGVPVVIKEETNRLLIAVGILIFIGGIYLLSKYSKSTSSSMNMFQGLQAKFVRVDLMTQLGKGVSFSDVAGLHEAKQEVMEFVDYLRKPAVYENLGAKIPRGALLLGPPGCGKTLLAKALANEAKVPFLAMAGSEFVEMIGGLGASRVRDLFKKAREESPCIIYIDEIDAIGRTRSGSQSTSGGNSEEEHTLNQLLVEMDGMGTKSDIIILASTNQPQVLDKALLRPGRFDRHILIDLPTLAERKETFEVYLRKLKLLRPVSEYVDRLASLSPGMTGADIANICNEAALHAARYKKTKIENEDFEYAVERVVAGVAKKSRVLSEQEKKVVAYHEAGHAVVGWLLQHTDSLLKVSIVPRTSSALGFSQYMPKDKMLHSKEELFEKMCMMLGGRVSESLTFNSITSGAQDDLQKVTRLAYEQIRRLGMSERLGPVAFDVSGENEMGVKPYSKQTARIIDQEAQLLITKAYKATECLLNENKEKVRVVAEALHEKETLNFKDMEELIGPPTSKNITIEFGPPELKPSPN